MHDIDEGAQGDSEWDDFEEWCRLNWIETGHPDAMFWYREAEGEDRDPHVSRGPLRSNFP
jgi:hypothetical protein